MFKKYNVLKNLTSFQKSLVNDFNKNPQIEFEKIQNKNFLFDEIIKEFSQ